MPQPDPRRPPATRTALALGARSIRLAPRHPRRRPRRDRHRRRRTLPLTGMFTGRLVGRAGREVVPTPAGPRAAKAPRRSRAASFGHVRVSATGRGRAAATCAGRGRRDDVHVRTPRRSNSTGTSAPLDVELAFGQRGTQRDLMVSSAESTRTARSREDARPSRPMVIAMTIRRAPNPELRRPCRRRRPRSSTPPVRWAPQSALTPVRPGRGPSPRRCRSRIR